MRVRSARSASAIACPAAARCIGTACATATAAACIVPACPPLHCHRIVGRIMRVQINLLNSACLSKPRNDDVAVVKVDIDL
eukprot:5998003-Prymnesium_polylepis.1